MGFRADGRTDLTKSLREGWWEDVEAADSARTGERGFARHRAGPLGSARLLEPLGMLNIYLGYAGGRGTGIAPAWVTFT